LKKTAAAAPLLPWRWRCGSGGGSGGAAMDISALEIMVNVCSTEEKDKSLILNRREKIKITHTNFFIFHEFIRIEIFTRLSID
jgi:hypothetical protein